MSAILTSETDEVLHPDLGPGARLRAERERRGLPRERVAAQLHLGEEMVEALEADDYDRLPGAVFVKGYVRNYARLLGIPAEPFLAELYERCPDQECAKFVTGNVRQEVRSNHLLMRLVTAAIVVGLLALLGVWWWNYKAPKTEESDAVAVDNGPAAETLGVSPSADRGGETKNGAGIPAASAPVAPASIPTETPLAPAAGAPPQAETLAPPVVAPAPAKSVPAAPPGGKVEITFDKPSWVDIRGADDSFKMIGLFRKGRRELSGHGPYKFVIGNVSAVRLEVNGKPYDLRSRTSGNVARFQLDPMRPDLD